MCDAPLRLSVAIPLYNEEELVGELLQRTLAVLDTLPEGPHELVLVDDGSTDRTRELVEAASAADDRIMLVVLSRNFGHQAALGAALDHVSGDAVVIMDGDLQDRPEVIPRFVEQFLRGHDVVYAQRIKRKEGWLLRVCYKAFYRLIGRLSDIDLPRDAGDFGLMSRRVVELIRGTPERHRYWRGLRSWVGFRQVGVPVERDPRFAGESKYTLRRLIRLAADGIFSFSVVPLRAATVVGGMTVAASGLFLAYTVVAKLLMDSTPQGFPALLTAITFLSGVQLMFLGIVGEYVGRIYEQVKARPVYIVQSTTRTPWISNTGPAIGGFTNSIGGGALASSSSSNSSVSSTSPAAGMSSTSAAVTDSSSLDSATSAGWREWKQMQHL